ncbi:MAG: 1,4-dihydroxy-6-naphthoate synthase [Bacteroidota bacterium]
MKIKLGFSTCPNDTFMFDAMVHGKIDTAPFEFEVVMEDILHLNKRAREGELDMVKISYNTFGHVWSQYKLLDAGSALGYKCGPLLISHRPLTKEQILSEQLLVGIPGKYTTANLLLGYYFQEEIKREEMLFHEIMPALTEDRIDAGVIIHENRFTYQNFGLQLVQDLGEYWEEKTGLPIPLGAIVAHRNLGEETVGRLEEIMHQSVAYAFSHPESSTNFVKHHAQEMDPTVMQAHIDLYVNDFSLSLGDMGKKAVQKVLATGEKMGLYPSGDSQRALT